MNPKQTETDLFAAPGDCKPPPARMSQFSQRLAPLRNKPEGKLLVHEIYKSIQGESTFAGLPCVFVRLAVCDLRCRWCDTPYAFAGGTLLDVGQVVQQVMASATSLVEITGGEPLLQPEVFSLMQCLADQGCTVLLETSGAQPIERVDRRVHIVMDLKCPDSGECDRNLWENLRWLKPSDEIKFVVASRRDFDWAIDVCSRESLTERFMVLMSPAEGLVEPRTLAEWILESGIPLRLQLQLHKILWGSSARGV